MAKFRAKVSWTVTCPAKIHGKPGHKSTHGWMFVGVQAPKGKHKQFGCPQCRAEKRK